MTASISINDMNPIYKQTQSFELKIEDLCPQDTLTLANNNFPAEYIYYIGEKTDAVVYNAIPAWKYNSRTNGEN